MKSYCLYPKRCGPNMNCPACMGPEIERLQERIRELEAQVEAWGQWAIDSEIESKEALNEQR